VPIQPTDKHVDPTDANVDANANMNAGNATEEGCIAVCNGISETTAKAACITACGTEELDDLVEGTTVRSSF
jgi:hypothetical protein